MTEVDLAGALAQAIRERDEALVALASKTSHATVCEELWREAMRERDEAEAGRQYWIKKCDEIAAEEREERVRVEHLWEIALRKRNEARANVEAARAWPNNDWVPKTSLDQALRERDEAQAATREVIEHSRTSYACRETLLRWQDRWPWAFEEGG